MADKLGWTASGMILKKGETRDSVGIRIPFYSTTAEIYDKGGDKYLLKSDFFMTNSKDPMATPHHRKMGCREFDFRNALKTPHHPAKRAPNDHL